jgi:hypothetical protein
VRGNQGVPYDLFSPAYATAVEKSDDENEDLALSSESGDDVKIPNEPVNEADFDRFELVDALVSFRV